MSEPAIRHYLDDKHRFNGAHGAWTNCGLPWTGTPEGIVRDCPECIDEDRQYRAERLQSGSSPRLAP